MISVSFVVVCCSCGHWRISYIYVSNRSQHLLIFRSEFWRFKIIIWASFFFWIRGVSTTMCAFCGFFHAAEEAVRAASSSSSSSFGFADLTVHWHIAALYCSLFCCIIQHCRNSSCFSILLQLFRLSKVRWVKIASPSAPRSFKQLPPLMGIILTLDEDVHYCLWASTPLMYLYIHIYNILIIHPCSTLTFDIQVFSDCIMTHMDLLLLYI